jgi:hypothetical protein
MPMPTEGSRNEPLGTSENAEEEKLKRLLEPIACDLRSIVVAWLGVERADGTRQMVRAVLDPFARQAIHGGLDCLAHRRIAEIKDKDLDGYAPECRRRLVRLIAEHCQRLCPADGPRPLRSEATGVEQAPPGRLRCRGPAPRFSPKRSAGRGGRHRGEPRGPASGTRAACRPPPGRQASAGRETSARQTASSSRIVFVFHVWRIS